MGEQDILAVRDLVKNGGLVSLLSSRPVYAKLLDIHEKGQVMSELQLKNLGNKFTHSDRMIRVRFWEEVNKSYKNGYPCIDAFAVYGNVCTDAAFFKKLNDEGFCHYLLNPVMEYGDSIKMVLHEQGEDVYKEILNKELAPEEDNIFNWTKLVSLKMRALARMEKLAGVDGVSKIAIGLDSRVSIDNGASNYKSMSIDDLRTKIGELETELGSGKSKAINALYVDKSEE